MRARIRAVSEVRSRVCHLTTTDMFPKPSVEDPFSSDPLVRIVVIIKGRGASAVWWIWHICSSNAQGWSTVGESDRTDHPWLALPWVMIDGRPVVPYRNPMAQGMLTSSSTPLEAGVVVNDEAYDNTLPSTDPQCFCKRFARRPIRRNSGKDDDYPCVQIDADRS